MTIRNPWLLVGGGLSLAASLIHLAFIAGGPAWYRALGAGEGMARAAARGDWRPAAITTAIAGLLAIAAAYAFSGAGLIGRLPLLKTALLLITSIYLLRGLVVLKSVAAGPTGSLRQLSPLVVADRAGDWTGSRRGHMACLENPVREVDL